MGGRKVVWFLANRKYNQIQLWFCDQIVYAVPIRKIRLVGEG